MKKTLLVLVASSLVPADSFAQAMTVSPLASVPISLPLTAQLPEALGLPREAAQAGELPALSLGASLREAGKDGSQAETLSNAFDRSQAAPAMTGLGLADEPAPSADVFTALTKAQKADFQARYRQHLLKRDGVPDVQAHKFSVRESFFEELKNRPVRALGALVDPAVFRRNELRRVPEKGLDHATLWALALAKANRAEREGVERRMASVDFSKRSKDDPLTFIEIEEFYHTRILKDALDIVGLDMRPLPPFPLTRGLVRFMAVLPMWVSNILIMPSEVAGVAAFRLLRDKAREVLKDQPEEVRSRVESLFQQIMVDEVGHVHFVRSQLGPVRLWLARRILPFLARYLMRDLPEAGLMFGRKNVLRAITKADVDGASAEYPDRLVPYSVLNVGR